MLRRILIAAGCFLFLFAIAAVYWIDTTPVPATSDQLASCSAELGLILVDEDDGLFVLAITENSTALHAGFRPGDKLLRSGDVHLTSAPKLESLLVSGPSTLDILLNRNGQEMLLELPLAKNLANKQRIHYTEGYTNLMYGGDRP